MLKDIRNRLNELKTDDDFDAFCVDEYRDVRSGFPSSASRQRRINLLLEREEPGEVDRKLSAWLEGRRTLMRPAPVRRNLIWAALAGGVAQALVILVVVLVMPTRSQPTPQIIVVPIEQINRQLLAQGLTRDILDSPEQFAAKVQNAGPGKLRYEVSVDRDQDTQELRRLVLALRVQNDQLVAATQYLLEQVKKWQHSTTPQTQLLDRLAQGIENKVDKQVVADLVTPVVHDMAQPPEDMSRPRPLDIAKPSPDMATQVNIYRPKMVPIRAGRFLMGSVEGEGDVDEQPPHEVQITMPFLLSQTEVTQGQYLAVTGARPSGFGSAPDWAQRPVERVSWFDAVEYCNHLSLKEGLRACYVVAGDDVKWPQGHACTGYRLPTEAEWEYAARAGQSNQYAGTNNIEDIAWNKNNSDASTHRVATKKANAWGLYDMSGNVFEWVWDWYAPYEQKLNLNPRGPLIDVSYRVLRGGCWDFDAWWLRTAVRVRRAPAHRDRSIGIRLSRSNP